MAGINYVPYGVFQQLIMNGFEPTSNSFTLSTRTIIESDNYRLVCKITYNKREYLCYAPRQCLFVICLIFYFLIILKILKILKILLGMLPRRYFKRGF